MFVIDVIYLFLVINILFLSKTYILTKISITIGKILICFETCYQPLNGIPQYFIFVILSMFSILFIYIPRVILYLMFRQNDLRVLKWFAIRRAFICFIEACYMIPTSVLLVPYLDTELNIAGSMYANFVFKETYVLGFIVYQILSLIFLLRKSKFLST